MADEQEQKTKKRRALLQKRPEPVKKFLQAVARQLVESNEVDCFSLSSQDLQQALDRFKNELPPGKLRSALLHPTQAAAAVAALQEQLLKTASEEDVFLSREHFALLSSWLKGSSRRVGLLGGTEQVAWACREAPVNVLWALAAYQARLQRQRQARQPKISSDASDDVVLSCALLLQTLKPFIIGHTSSSTALAAFAPVAFLLFQALQEVSKYNRADLTTLQRNSKLIGSLQAIVKEVLGMMVICLKCPSDSLSTQSLQWPPLLDSFSSVIGSINLQGITSWNKSLQYIEKIRLMFPLVPNKTLETMHLAESVKFTNLARIVTVEFVLIQLILTVFHQRKEMKTQERERDGAEVKLMDELGRIAIHGVAALKHGDELVLDLLLTSFSDIDILHDKEKKLIHDALYKALLVKIQGLLEMSSRNLPRKKKRNSRIFVKCIAVARNLISNNRLVGEQSLFKDFLYKVCAPLEFSKLLKAADFPNQAPKKVQLSNKDLIGWLLKMENKEFQEILNWVTSKKTQEFGLKSPIFDGEVSPVSKAEGLFFVDVTGGKMEEEYRPDEISSQRSRKDRKRKRGQIVFHRHKPVTAHDIGTDSFATEVSSDED